MDGRGRLDLVDEGDLPPLAEDPGWLASQETLECNDRLKPANDGHVAEENLLEKDPNGLETGLGLKGHLKTFSLINVLNGLLINGEIFR